MKRLAMMLSDENDATLWMNNILHNMNKVDIFVIGCIGSIGPSLKNIESLGAILINLSEQMEDFCLLRNKLIGIIYQDSRFNDSIFFLNIDTDERILGDIPKYIDGNFNCLYQYYWPSKNASYIGNAAWVSTEKKVIWLGNYHNQPTFLGKSNLTDSFAIIHDRKSDIRKHDPVDVLLKIDANDYESKIALVQNIVDKCKNNKDNESLSLSKYAFDIFSKLKIPTHLIGEYYNIYFYRKELIRFNLSRILEMNNDANSAMESFLNSNQRFGFYLEWLVNGRTDNSHYKEKYKSIVGTEQYIDMFDYKRIWT